MLTSFCNANFTQDSNPSELEAIEFLERYDKVESEAQYKLTLAHWNFNVNISDETLEAKLKAGEESGAQYQEFLDEALSFDLTNFTQDVRRKLGFIREVSLPAEEQSELDKIISEMGQIYSEAKVCFNESEEAENEVCKSLSPDLKEIMANSIDYEERTYTWKEWRNYVGVKCQPLYERYVELKNKKAKLNGFADFGEEMRSNYAVEDDPDQDFEADMLAIYDELKPLYQSLHAYVRRKLNKVYGDEHVPLNGTLPASILSDMWGRFWANLYQHMIPYPDKPNIQPGAETMRAANMTVEEMVRTTEDFYVGLGFEPLPEMFLNDSLFRKPTDGRTVQCHATAWDFYNGKDFRVKMCAKDFSFGNFLTIHHEMGHTVYQMAYRHQHLAYRDGANNGFHEAIGELMAMVAATPSYLNQIGILDELVEDDEADINFLLSQSLITISTLPFHLVNDLWRWKLYRGEYQDGEWNDEYWKLKEKYLGVRAPVERTENDLDPPTIFHINQDYGMMRYFTRTILQFQFAQSLCDISGHEGPLHRCNFSGSLEAGKALREMLALGRSVPWADALEKLTGTRKMSATAILKFFEPLAKWLERENAESDDVPGWE